MARTWLALGAALVTLGLSARALADAIPPEQDACTGKSAGATCVDEGASGTCVDATCTRLDYSRGTPPRSVEYACVKCDTTGTPPASEPAAEPAAEAAAADTATAAAETVATTGTQATGSGCAGAELGGLLGLAGILVALGARRPRHG